MLTTTVHLTTIDIFQQGAQVNHSEIIVEAFIESCKALDASIFEPYMEEDNVFEDKNKYLFLASMKALFASYKDKKILFFKITVEDSTCKGCQFGKEIKLFSIKGWGRVIIKDQFAYVIEKENGVLKDIYRCNLFC